MKTYNWIEFNQIVEATQGENLTNTIQNFFRIIEEEFKSSAIIISNQGKQFRSKSITEQQAFHFFENRKSNEALLDGYRDFPLHDFGKLYIINNALATQSTDFLQALCNTIGLVLENQSQIEQSLSKQHVRQSISHNREALFRYMLRHMNLGIIEFDTQRYIQYANRSFSKLSGYSLSELIGYNLDEFPFSNWEKVSDYQSDQTDVFIGKTFEIIFTDCYGLKRYWLISGSQIFNEQKELTGTIGIVLDITTHKNMQLELSKQKDIAEKASLAKERFLATLSHEIRNPLNIIIGSLNQVQNAESKDQLRSYLKSSHQSADYLMALLNNILDYTTIDEEGLVLQESKFIPQDVVLDVADYFSLMAENKNVALKVYDESQQRHITLGDASKLKQILYGLIGNAIKYTRKGEVTITSKLESDKSESNLFSVSIKDTGNGIKDATLNKFKSNENIDRQDFLLGDGMGLNLINRLVQFLNGQMHIESSGKNGTLVQFTIPLKLEIKSEQQTEQLASAIQLKNHRILIVEDQVENQKLAEIILRRNHFICEFASNGMQAIKALEANAYDLILMDIQMPEMDGVTASKFIRSNISRDIPIIAVTANAFSKDVKHYLNSGMDDVVVKPYTESDLVDRINNQIANRTSKLSKVDDALASRPYNLKVMEELCNGDRLFLMDMLKLFIEITPVSLHELRTSIHQQQFQDASRVAHRMKQSIGNMGMHQTREKVVEIERICKSGNPETMSLNALFNAIEKDLTACIQDLKMDFQL